MLFVSPVRFYISKVIVNPDKEKIQKMAAQFDEIVAKIKEDDRFKYISFGRSTFDWLFKKDQPSQEELKQMRGTLEKNGYSVTKRKVKTENDVRCEGIVKWSSSAQPEEIREFIKRWNEIDGPNSLNHFVLNYYHDYEMI